MPDLEGFTRAMEHLRTIDPEMPAQMTMTLVLVHTRPGITLSQIAAGLGTTIASASRLVYALSDLRAPGKPGHGLVESRANPYNRREKNVHLTQKGERFMKTLRDVLRAPEADHLSHFGAPLS